jgi:hypothetical protein
VVLVVVVDVELVEDVLLVELELVDDVEDEDVLLVDDVVVLALSFHVTTKVATNWPLVSGPYV